MRTKIITTLAVLLSVSWAASAQSGSGSQSDDLTVASGTQTNFYIPFIYGFYWNSYQHSQTIYPASMVQDMQGGEITALSWHLNTTSTTPIGITIVIRLAEVEQGSFSTAAFSDDELTTVYTGTLSATDDVTTFVFDTPFAYNGGNLLVDVYNTSTTDDFNVGMITQGISSTGASVIYYEGTDPCPTAQPTIQDYIPMTTFTYSVGEQACERTASVAASDITSNSFTLTWDAVSGAAQYIVSLNGAEYATTTETTLLIDSLSGGTAYMVSVVTDCGSALSAPRSVSVRTACGTLTLPWSEDLNDDAAIDCWTIIDGDGDGSAWEIYENSDDYYGYLTDGKSIYGYYSEDGNVNDWLISPVIDLTGVENTMFSWGVMGTSYYDGYSAYTVRVAAAGDDIEVDTASFTTIYSETFDATNIEQWLTRTIDLSAYDGQQIRIAFNHRCGDDDGLLLDNMTLISADYPVVSISGPEAALLGENATFSVVVEGGDEATMDYAWTSARVLAGDATIQEDFNTITINYTAGDYDTITLTATNTFGTATATFIVRLVGCTAIDSLPWTADLDSANSLDCWTLLDLDGDSSTWTNLDGDTPYGYLRVQDTTAWADNWAITPQILVPEDAEGLMLTFDDWLGTATAATAYEVLVAPYGGTTPDSFTDSLFGNSGSRPSWATQRVTLGDYGGNTIRIAFRHTADINDGGLRLRDITLRMAREPLVAISGPTTVELGDSAVYSVSLIEGLTDGISYTWTSTLAAAGLATMYADDDTLGMMYTGAGQDTLRVIVQNAYGADTAMMVINVRDLSPVSTFPYTTGFEDAADNTHWQMQCNNETNLWVIDTAAKKNGTKGLYVSRRGGTNNYVGGETNTYAAGVSTVAYAWRLFDIQQAGDYSIQFDWKAKGEGTADFLRVFVVPFGTTFPSTHYSIKHNELPAGYIAADGGARLNLATLWQSGDYSFTIDSAGLYELVFCWRNDGAIGSNPPAAVDNLTVDRLGCRSPQALTADSLGTDYVAFHWTAVGDATTWEVRVGDAAPIITSNTSHVITGVNPATTYTISVRSICGEGDTSVASTIMMTTECGEIVNFPWSEGFENRTMNLTPDCWTPTVHYSSTNYDYPLVYGSTATAHSGEHYLYNEIRNNTYAITASPILATPANTLRGSVWVKGYGSVINEDFSYTYHQLEMEVGVMTDPEDESTFISIFDTTMDTYGLGWAIINFSAEACGIDAHAALAFRATLSPYSTTGYFHIDDLIVYNDGTPAVVPPCATPTDLHVAASTPNTITIDWTPGDSETAWELERDGQAISVSAHPYVVSGLTPETNYSFRLRAVCGEDDYSEWTDAISATTHAEGVSAVDAIAFSLYPNPASSTATIETTSNSTVSIIDQSGRVIRVLSVERGKAIIDVSELSKGAYFVRVVSNEGTAVRKLVVK